MCAFKLTIYSLEIETNLNWVSYAKTIEEAKTKGLEDFAREGDYEIKDLKLVKIEETEEF